MKVYCSKLNQIVKLCPMVSSTSHREDKWAGYHGREGACRLVIEGHAEQKMYKCYLSNWEETGRIIILYYL